MKECPEINKMEQERQESINAECGICHDKPIEKERRFGLLTGCDHSFCLDCIRKWRGILLGPSKETLRSCPLCRQPSYFIVPCDRFITNSLRKNQIVENYVENLHNIPCKHFSENEDCPFSTSCFYKHIRKDGTIVDKVKLQHLINQDGKVEIQKELILSEFLFPNM